MYTCKHDKKKTHWPEKWKDDEQAPKKYFTGPGFILHEEIISSY
jgi:hypothetical protein